MAWHALVVPFLRGGWFQAMNKPGGRGDRREILRQSARGEVSTAEPVLNPIHDLTTRKGRAGRRPRFPRTPTATPPGRNGRLNEPARAPPRLEAGFANDAAHDKPCPGTC